MFKLDQIEPYWDGEVTPQGWKIAPPGPSWSLLRNSFIMLTILKKNPIDMYVRLFIDFLNLNILIQMLNLGEPKMG